MAIAVRPIEAADAAAWDQLFRDYITFYEARVSDAIIAQTWQRVLRGQDNMAGLIAVDDNAVAVGIVNMVFHPSSWSATSYCYLEDLYVCPSARGAGVGRQLILATYDLADQHGCSRVYWATQATNLTARRLYDDVAVLTEFVQYRRASTD